MISTYKMNGQQLSTRNLQLAKKQEHLVTEIAKQESFVSSLDERIKIVSENYSDPRQIRIAQELSRLNEKKSSITSQQSNIVTESKRKRVRACKVYCTRNCRKIKIKNPS